MWMRIRSVLGCCLGRRLSNDESLEVRQRVSRDRIYHSGETRCLFFAVLWSSLYGVVRRMANKKLFPLFCTLIVEIILVCQSVVVCFHCGLPSSRDYTLLECVSFDAALMPNIAGWLS